MPSKDTTSRQNNEIQKDSNDLLGTTLRNLIREKGLRLLESKSNQEDEVGVDFYYEIHTREENYEHKILLLNQNKGTNNALKVKKRNPHKGKIQFQIELRHCKYWTEQLDVPLVFTLCDVTNSKVYWYLIQNDERISKRIIEQENEGKNSLQIYIPAENTLDSENIDRFLSEVNHAKTNQIIKKHGVIFEDKASDYSFLKNEAKGKHLIDSIYYFIELFESIKVIPENIINQLFSNVLDSKCYVREFSLFTDSEELYDLIVNIGLSKDKKKYFLKDGGIHVKEQEEKLKSIIEFFRINLLNHLEWCGKMRKDKPRICVHHLYIYGFCDCERCNFERLNFKKTENLLKLEQPNYSEYEKLRKGYAAYLYGNLELAVDVFWDLHNSVDKNKNPIVYIISKFNLIQLKNVNASVFHNHDYIKIKLDGIDNDSDKGLITTKAQYFLDIYNPLKNFRFLYNSFYYIDKLLYEIQRIWERDKRGGWSSDNKLFELEASFLRTLYFLEHNLIILDYYSEFKSIAFKALEGAIALHTLKNKEVDKYIFEFPIIEMWIFHVEHEKAMFLFKKYAVKHIELLHHEEFLKRVNQYFENLNLSLENISTNKSSVFIFKLDNILKNLLLLISKLKLEGKEINKLLSKVLDFSERVEINRFIEYMGIMNIIYSNPSNISKDNLLRFIKLWDRERLNNGHFSFLIKLYVENSTKEEIREFIFQLLKEKKLTIDIIKDELHIFRDLFYAFSLLDEKKELSDLILSSLQEDFDDELYSSALIFDIIEYDEDLFNKYLETIPDLTKRAYPNFMRPQENFRFEQAINLSYKFNLPLDRLKKYLDYCYEEQREFYKWLLDIENYDYSNFDTYWLVRGYTIYFIEKFKKSKKLKETLTKSLKENYNDEVAKFYFNELLD